MSETESMPQWLKAIVGISAAGILASYVWFAQQGAVTQEKPIETMDNNTQDENAANTMTEPVEVTEPQHSEEETIVPLPSNTVEPPVFMPSSKSAVFDVPRLEIEELELDDIEAFEAPADETTNGSP